jgi:hypothetical protein
MVMKFIKLLFISGLGRSDGDRNDLSAEEESVTEGLEGYSPDERSSQASRTQASDEYFAQYQLPLSPRLPLSPTVETR